MKKIFSVVLTMLSLAGGVNGQRLYRKELDTAAQQALKAIEKVDSKDLFDRMLQNLSAQSRQDFETTYSGIRRQTRDRIQTWDNWCAVHADMVLTMRRFEYPGLLTANPRAAAAEPALRTACARLLEKSDDAAETNPKTVVDEWNGLVEQVKKARADRQSEIDALKAEPKTEEPRLLALLGQLGDLTEAEQAVAEFKASTKGRIHSLAAPAAETVAILSRLGEAYKEFQERRDQIQKVQKELRELRAEMLKIAVLKLVAEEEHLKRMIAIETRRAREIEDAVTSFEQYRTAVTCERQRNPDLDLKRIDESLRELGQSAAADKSTTADEYLYTRDLAFHLTDAEADFRKFCKETSIPARLRLEALTRALFQAAAVQTRGATPEYLAELRRAQEQQRYSIIQSSLEARAYETLVETGVRRLALLHAGGIKPSEIAQLVYQAGQLAGVSVIAVKQ